MEARQLVGEYAAAARAAGQNAMAAQQLNWMFEAADDGFLRHDIIRALRALGDDARSASESRPTGPLDHDEFWARVLRGTLAPPPPPAPGAAG
jgi:hypothetical protein